MGCVCVGSVAWLKSSGLETGCAGITVIAFCDEAAVIAFCDKGATDGTPPAKAQLNKAAAEVGAKMISASDEDLMRLLFAAGVLYAVSTGQVCVSVSTFKKIFACDC